MNEQQKEFLRFLKLLNDNECLDAVVVVGSWAELLYQECGIVKGFVSNLRTLDIDFLLKNLRMPRLAKNLPLLARESGYLVESERLTGITKIYDPNGLEIEFLLGKRGAGLETALKTNLGVVAQTLRNTEILRNNILIADYYGMLVSVPVPEAYVLHKMIINAERGIKQEKDIQAILNLYPLLHENTYKNIKDTLTKKQIGVINNFEESYLR